MVKRLKRKFVLLSMGALTFILVLLVVVLNLANYLRVQNNADDLLRILAENGGSFPGGSFGMERGEGDPADGQRPGRAAPGADDMPPEDSPGGANPPGGLRGGRRGGRGLFRDNELFGYIRTAETPFESRWFWVLTDGEGRLVRADVAHIAAVDRESAYVMARAVLQRGVKSGIYEGYRFLVSDAEEDDDLTRIVFLDRQSEYHSVRLIFAVSVITSAAVLLLMLILVTAFSGRAVAPIAEAFEKQKQFISDASHELKTPLSVISADVDVLELEGEKSEWTDSIRDQIARMNQLIRDMLTLSRMEDEKLRVVFSDVDLSRTVRRAAEPFSTVARAAGKVYEAEIAPDIHMQGDGGALAQLVSILSDNAMKYSAAESRILLTLRQEGTRIFLEAVNTCDQLPEGNLDRLFDRFYRADTSRTRGRGGFGIGLSVARAIVASHGGRIRAERDGDHIIRFVAEFPGK